MHSLRRGRKRKEASLPKILPPAPEGWGYTVAAGHRPNSPGFYLQKPNYVERFSLPLLPPVLMLRTDCSLPGLAHVRWKTSTDLRGQREKAQKKPIHFTLLLFHHCRSTEHEQDLQNLLALHTIYYHSINFSQATPCIAAKYQNLVKCI